MEKYSIFERGMHWIMLGVIVLHVCTYMFFWNFHWNPNPFGWRTVLEAILPGAIYGNVFYISIFLVYAFIYFLNRKTKKNTAMLFVGLLLFRYVVTTGFELAVIRIPAFLEPPLLIIRFLIWLIFFINIFTTEKIESYSANNLEENILDSERY